MQDEGREVGDNWARCPGCDELKHIDDLDYGYNGDMCIVCFAGANGELKPGVTKKVHDECGTIMDPSKVVYGHFWCHRCKVHVVVS